MKLLGRGLGSGATQAVSEKSLVRYAGFILVQLSWKLWPTTVRWL